MGGPAAGRGTKSHGLFHPGSLSVRDGWWPGDDPLLRRHRGGPLALGVSGAGKRLVRSRGTRGGICRRPALLLVSNLQGLPDLLISPIVLRELPSQPERDRSGAWSGA